MRSVPGQGVDVGFCHSCQSGKMRQKHLGLLESSRGPPHHVQTDTRLVSDHTYRWGPFVINDFSNLTHSPSPTPELYYTRDGTCEYLLFVSTKKQGIRPIGFFEYACVCLCVCARVWAACRHHAKQVFLVAVHSLTFGQTSCRYMSSSR